MRTIKTCPGLPRQVSHVVKSRTNRCAASLLCATASAIGSSPTGSAGISPLGSRTPHLRSLVSLLKPFSHELHRFGDRGIVAWVFIPNISSSTSFCIGSSSGLPVRRLSRPHRHLKGADSIRAGQILRGEESLEAKLETFRYMCLVQSLFWIVIAVMACDAASGRNPRQPRASSCTRFVIGATATCARPRSSCCNNQTGMGQTSCCNLDGCNTVCCKSEENNRESAAAAAGVLLPIRPRARRRAHRRESRRRLRGVAQQKVADRQHGQSWRDRY